MRGLETRVLSSLAQKNGVETRVVSIQASGSAGNAGSEQVCSKNGLETRRLKGLETRVMSGFAQKMALKPAF